MGRNRKEPINNPFLQQLMDKKEFGTLQEASSKTKIPLSTLCKMAAEPQSENMQLRAILRAARGFGVSCDVWILGNLGELSITPISE